MKSLCTEFLFISTGQTDRARRKETVSITTNRHKNCSLTEISLELILQTCKIHRSRQPLLKGSLLLWLHKRVEWVWLAMLTLIFLFIVPVLIMLIFIRLSLDTCLLQEHHLWQSVLLLHRLKSSVFDLLHQSLLLLELIINLIKAINSIIDLVQSCLAVLNDLFQIFKSEIFHFVSLFVFNVLYYNLSSRFI